MKAPLTSRQLEVSRHFLDGKHPHEIASILGIGKVAVTVNLHRVRRRLGVKGNAVALADALRGIV